MLTSMSCLHQVPCFSHQFVDRASAINSELYSAENCRLFTQHHDVAIEQNIIILDAFIE